MAWDVYCPVLPKGWHVNNGSWATAKGGRVEISYSGPSGAVLALKEGTFCTGGISLCSAHDTIVGAAAFGDRVGSLDTLGPGLGLAIYVDAGQAPMWQMTGNGMDQATFAGFAAALKKVPKS